jgi:phenylpropionate dioxygenase-like ring-hydroxylating dioxygenase large terminal subunit
VSLRNSAKRALPLVGDVGNVAGAPKLPPLTEHFHPVLAARKLREKPVRVDLAGRAYVLFRDRSGRASALVDACPHRKAPLSRGRVREDGRLACPYHGWHFDGDGRGVCPSQPTLAGCDTESLRVVEYKDYLWIAEHGVSQSKIPELEYDGFDFAGTVSVRAKAPLHVVFDNFSENEHTPYVHDRLGWVERDADTIQFEAHNFADRTEVMYSAMQRPSRLVRLFGIEPGDHYRNEWVTRFSPIHSVYTIYWANPHTGEKRPLVSRYAIFFVPETETTTRIETFGFVQIRDPRYERFRPAIKKAALLLGWKEIWDDARFVPMIASTPFELRGMRLDKFDKPIVHNRRLMKSLYLGERGERGERAEADDVSVSAAE